MEVNASEGGHLKHKTRRLVVKTCRSDLAKWFLKLSVDLPEASDYVASVCSVNGQRLRYGSRVANSLLNES